MADLYSKKLLIQLSLSLFVVGSLIAGFTPNLGVRTVYGVATADLFPGGGADRAADGIAVLFITEKPLHTLSGDERRAQEDAAAAAAPLA